MKTRALLLVAALGAARNAAAAPARPVVPEVVIANQQLVEAGEHVQANLDAFLRRLEEVTGWPPKSLRGKAFTRPAEALAYIKKRRVAFAILPPHQLVEGRKALKLEVLAIAPGRDGYQPSFWILTRQPRPFAGFAAGGMRLAATEVYDPVWLAIQLDGKIDPTLLRLQEVPTPAAAVQALVDKKADLAIVPEGDWKTQYERRAQPGGDLEQVLFSGNLPPPAFLAVGKHVTPADKAKMAAALDQVCKTTGATACARVGIHYIQSGHADLYENVISVYDAARATVRR